MMIKYLPIELQELVHRRQIDQGNDGTFDGDLSRGRSGKNFDWVCTVESSVFWCSVYNGEDVTKSPHYPKKGITFNFLIL